MKLISCMTSTGNSNVFVCVEEEDEEEKNESETCYDGVVECGSCCCCVVLTLDIHDIHFLLLLCISSKTPVIPLPRFEKEQSNEGLNM